MTICCRSAGRMLQGVALLLALAPIVVHAAPQRSSVMLLGVSSPGIDRAVRRELGRRRLELVVPAPHESDEPGRDPAASASAQAVSRATRTLSGAQDLYYAVRADEAATLLGQEIERSARGLVLARRFDLLRELYLWQGICHGKLGDSAAAARAFAAAVTLEDRGLDRRRFAPVVVEAFDAVRARLASRPLDALVLDVAPASAAVVVDGKPVARSADRRTIRLRRGEHWVLVEALGYTSVARRVRLQHSTTHLQLALVPAPRTVVVQQIDELRARGELDATRVDVASALGRLQGVDEALIVGERQADGELHLSLVRVRCVDGQILGRQAGIVGEQRDLDRAVGRAVGLLWPGRRPDAGRPLRRPLYRRWWFWTAVGLAVAGGAAASIAVVTTRPPETYTVRFAP